MKNFKISISFIVLFVILGLFSSDVEEYLHSVLNGKFLAHLLIVILCLIFILFFSLKYSWFSKNKEHLISFILPFLILMFFILKNTLLFYQFTLLQLIITGVIVSIEKKNIQSSIPLVLMIIFSVSLELSLAISKNTHFYYLDILIYLIIQFSSYSIINSIRLKK